MSILGVILGFILMMTGIGAMAFFALTFFFPTFATQLWFRRARLPRIYAVVGFVTGMEIYFLGMMLIDIGVRETAQPALRWFAGFIPMFTGMAMALAFFIGFLYPPFLRVLQIRPDRQPRRRALAGILAGYVLIVGGGFVCDFFDGGKMMLQSFGIMGTLMALGTMGCFFLAFLFPPVLDVLRIKRGKWPHFRALLGIWAGFVFFCFVASVAVSIDMADTSIQNMAIQNMAALLFITGMAMALAFFAALLCPPFLRVLQVRPDRRPRLRALAGILVGYVFMGVGGFVWDVLDGERSIMIPILGITSVLMAWGTIGCFFLAFLYPPLLDKLWITRGVNPRLQALEFMLAGMAFFLLVGLIFFELLR